MMIEPLHYWRVHVARYTFDEFYDYYKSTDVWHASPQVHACQRVILFYGFHPLLFE